ncbi:MAG: peptidylprolyl isomerase [Bryobacteraceae bacterium]
MPILVNGEVVPDALIRAEEQRVRVLPEWKAAEEHPEFKMRLRAAAEDGAINRVVLAQAAARVTAPLDETEIDHELARQTAAGGCRSAFDARELRSNIANTFLTEAVIRDVAGPMSLPSERDIRKFYETNRGEFLQPESVKVAHVVKHVDERCGETEASRVIEEAQGELERGTPFDAVVLKYSDCKENHGELGYFARGVMVEEFDQAVFALRPGERTGIFRTPFGFHIAEMRERRAPMVVPFGEVRADIEKALIFGAKREAFERAITKLRGRAEIRRISRAEAQKLQPRASGAGA